MDDCNLEKLTISPGKLNPAFHQDTQDYSVILGCEVEKVKLTPLTRDSGASCQVIGEGVEGKTVTLIEGKAIQITIEVTAEDGITNKEYKISFKRLSANDADLAELEVIGGFDLVPPFNPSIAKYNCYVPANINQIEFKAISPDKKSSIGVCNNGMDTIELSPLNLNIGDTNCNIVCTSPNGLNKATYNVIVRRQELPLEVSTYALLKYTKLVSCSFCLSLVYIPYKTSTLGDKFIFCSACIDLLTRTNKEHPIDGTKLTDNWKVYCPDVELRISTFCPPALPLLKDSISLRELSKVWIDKLKSNHDAKTEANETCSSCSKKIFSRDKNLHDLKLCTTKFPIGKTEHKVISHKWEAQLQTILGDRDVKSLLTEAESSEQSYLQSLPALYNDSNQPALGYESLGCLQQAASCYATAIKLQPKNQVAHVGLGRIFEEMFYATDIFGLKTYKGRKDQDEDDEDMSEDKSGNEAVESGKQEEFEGLLHKIGVASNAPLALQLKAVDQEYQSLKEEGKQPEAEYVQSLYGWKSKQAHKSTGAQAGFSQEGDLGRAKTKYLDAISAAPSEHAPRFKLGRLLLDLGDYESALPHLIIATGIKPCHTESRFCLGIALLRGNDLSLQASAAKLILEGIDNILRDDAIYKCAHSNIRSVIPPLLHPDVYPLWFTSSTLVRACIDLAKYVRSKPQSDNLTTESGLPVDFTTACHWSSSLASRAINYMSSRKETYSSLMWSILEVHYMLLENAIQSKSYQPVDIYPLCQQLAGLLNVCGLQPSPSLTELKLNTSKQAVILMPCSTLLLGLLGDAQLSKADEEIQNEKQCIFLSKAEMSFRAALEGIGKPLNFKQPSTYLSEQDWWIEKIKKQQSTAKIATTSSNNTTNKNQASMNKDTTTKSVASSGTRNPVSVSATSNKTGAIKPTTKTGGTTKLTTAPAKSTNVPAKSTTVPVKSTTNKPTTNSTMRPGPTAVPKAADKPGSVNKITANKNVATLGQIQAGTGTANKTNNTNKETVVPPPQIIKEEIIKESIEADNASPELNPKTYHPFLGLARVLSKQIDSTSTKMTEAKTLYATVIDICPELHDAYIEMAELMLKHSNPMAAVDVYVKYPFSEQPTFDDAYLYGEIVRLILKEEQYDDARLVHNMIQLGKIMGITVLDKYVKILEDKYKNRALMEIYAGIHGKSVDDPDLIQFFRFKCWI